MKIVKAYPPNYADIVTRFPRAVNRGTVFSYGDTIFNPCGSALPQSIIAHETVHGQRQADPAEWWRTYIADVEFRLHEEALAHAVEFGWLVRNAVSRHERRAALSYVAKKLSSPLYGPMLTLEKAKRLIWDMDHMARSLA